MSTNEKPYHRMIKPLRELGSKKGLWVNNLTLKKTFEAGDTVNVFYDKTAKVVIVEKAEILGNHTISCRKSDEKKTPILDIKNSSFTDVFKDVELVELELYKNKLVVKVAKKEQKRNERLNKNGLKTFELFAGAGTLTQMFKQASPDGFIPSGGLEYEGSTLKIFEDNHTTSTYTIHSAIEDVCPEDMPKDIDVVLCGIPCTVYSNSNKSMIEAMARYKKGEATKEDMELVEKRHEAEYLVYYVLELIRAINPKLICVEEVVAFSTTNASNLLRGILKHMGYSLSEAVIQGTNNSRRRWCLVANMGKKVELDNLVPSSSKTIEDCLETPISKRIWKKKEDIPRIAAADRKESVGIRRVYPSDTMAYTFTTHGTRSTECVLCHPQFDLFSEFTNEEIKNIHGLSKDFKLSGIKTLDRKILGQGVVNGFEYVAKAILETNNLLVEKVA